MSGEVRPEALSSLLGDPSLLRGLASVIGSIASGGNEKSPPVQGHGAADASDAGGAKVEDIITPELIELAAKLMSSPKKEAEVVQVGGMPERESDAPEGRVLGHTGAERDALLKALSPYLGERRRRALGYVMTLSHIGELGLGGGGR